MSEKTKTFWGVEKPDGSLKTPYNLQMPALYKNIGDARRYQGEGKVVRILLTISDENESKRIP